MTQELVDGHLASFVIFLPEAPRPAPGAYAARPVADRVHFPRRCREMPVALVSMVACQTPFSYFRDEPAASRNSCVELLRL